VEQMAAALGGWLGASPAELSAVFANLGAFDVNLGLMA